MFRYKKQLIILLLLSFTFFFKECSCNSESSEKNTNNTTVYNKVKQKTNKNISEITLSSGFPAPVFDLKIKLSDGLLNIDNYSLVNTYRIEFSIIINMIFILLILFLYYKFNLYEKWKGRKIFAIVLVINIFCTNTFMLVNLNQGLIISFQQYYNFLTILIAELLSCFELSFEDANLISRTGFIINVLTEYFFVVMVYVIVKNIKRKLVQE